MRDIKVTVGAGLSVPIHQNASHITLKTSTGALRVQTDQGADVTLDEGQGGPFPPFKKFLLVNESASDITATIVVGNGLFHDNQLPAVDLAKPSGIASSSVAVLTSATLLAAANTTRRELLVSNPASNVLSVWVGAAGLAVGQGTEVAPGQTASIEVTAAVYAIASSTGVTVGLNEVSD